MNHLRVLKILAWVDVALLVVAVVAIVATLALSLGAVVAAEPAAAAAVRPTLAVTALSLLPVAALIVLAVAVALTIESGKGRVPQTLLALAGLSSIPLGTAYGLYALWVCWVNEETRARFVRVAPATVAAWVAFSVASLFVPLGAVIGLSVAAVMPTDLAALDAEWEPFEDRSRRQSRGPGCALDEVPPDCEKVTASVRTEEVTFPTRGVAMGFSSLNGTLYVPDSSGPRPAVILLHGSGPTDRHARSPGEVVRSPYPDDLPIFDALADHLAHRGFVVLTYDKRSCGPCYPAQHTNADYTQFRWEQYLDDAQAAIDWLGTRPEVDADAVVAIGHSEGGGLVPHLAARDDRVVAVVMLAGLSSTFRDALLGQLHAVAEIRRRQYDWLQAWAVEGMIAGYAQCLDRLEGAYDPHDMCLGGGVTLEALAEYEAMNRRTPLVLAALDVPLFAASGTVDRNVGPEQLLAIREAAKGDAEFHLIARMGHGLRDLIEPTTPASLDPTLLERLDAFLGSVTAEPRSPASGRQR